MGLLNLFECWHKWGLWSPPEEVLVKEYPGTTFTLQWKGVRQTRQCFKCGLVESKIDKNTIK